MKLLTQLRVDFSDLRDHRFDHKFNCPSPTCSCGIEDETSTHFLLCCPRYSNLRHTYLSKISQIVKSDVTILPYDHLTDLLLYGSKAYNDITNELILTETILFIYKSERFKVLEAFAWFFPLTIAWHLPPGPWRQALWTSCAPYVCLSNVMYKCFFSHLWVCDGDPAVSSRMPVPITQQSSCTLLFIFF